jgi:hypothetical protein
MFSCLAPHVLTAFSLLIILTVRNQKCDQDYSVSVVDNRNSLYQEIDRKPTRLHKINTSSKQSIYIVKTKSRQIRKIALRKKHPSMGLFKFQWMTTLILAVLQVVSMGLAVGGAAENNRSRMPPLQWYCSPLLDAARDIAVGIQSYPPYSSIYEPYWGVCQLRGGEEDTSILEQEEALSDNFTISAMVRVERKDYSPYTFSLFQQNDGSETDPDGIPLRYLKMQNNNRKHAKHALEATIKWRKENDIDTILARPHPKFDAAKSVFPHYFCGRDNTNHVILLQRPGLIDIRAAHANGLNGHDLLFHYIYVMEYLWQILEPQTDATMTSIMDLTGISLSVLGKPEILNVLRMFCSTMDAHFPQRGHRMLLINAPRWFGSMYKLLSPLLRETTKERIMILSKGKKQDEALRELISECDPMAALSNVEPADMEQDLRAFVSQ